MNHLDTDLHDFGNEPVVLVVDDDTGLQNLIIRSLRKSGFTAECFSTGTAAVERITHDSDVLILLDQKLPDMTGLDIIQVLGAKGIKAPFIMMTGQGDEKLAVEMMKLGAYDYLVKDIGFLDLLPSVVKRVYQSVNTEKKLRAAELEKMNLKEQLTQAQKMEFVGRLAGGVAHDFNNMLGVILGHADLAMQNLELENPVFEHLQEILRAAERSADLTRQLLAFARKQTIVPKILNLNDTIAWMLKMVSRLIGEDIDLSWQPGHDLWKIKMDPTQIDQILANLCVNARDAINGVGRIEIATENVTVDISSIHHASFGLDYGEYVVLLVKDDGCGMDSGTMAHIYEPFFTTKEVGKGTGLGLATVYGIVRQNNGFIDVYSEKGNGTIFKVYFPRSIAESDIIAEQSGKGVIESGNGTIMIVEDEPSILKLSSMMLSHMGYETISASTPVEAVELAREHGNKIMLVMTDIIMPGMNGKQLYDELLSINPDIRYLYMSGYTADVIAVHGVLDEGVNYIQKPFTMKELAVCIRKAMG